MKNKTFFILFALAIGGTLNANDSEYYTSGNQLVPLESKNVRLDKEVLTIRKSKYKNYNSPFFYVDVEYTLFNEGDARKTLVGFESVGNVGDAEPEGFFENNYDDKKVLNAEKKAISYTTGKYKNEYVKDFSVRANGKKVSYKTANVGKIKKDKHTSPYVGSLYYFPVYLKKGVNKIHQTYYFDSGSAVYTRYEFSYILETAKRWKGGVIKDFTLILNMGDLEEFSIVKTFFKDTKNWKLNGKIVHIPYKKDDDSDYAYTNDYVKVYVNSGSVVFRKKNFVPNSTIYLASYKDFKNYGIFDYRTSVLPFYGAWQFYTAADKDSLETLKAHPYAKRGYVFKNKKIDEYYKRMQWYMPNKNYRKNYSKLTKDEKEWLNDFKKIHRKILRNLPYARRGYIFKDYTLNEFCKTRKWYKENKNYKPSFKSLPIKEQKWIEKIRSIKELDFFKLLNEYNAIYESKR